MTLRQAVANGRPFVVFYADPELEPVLHYPGKSETTFVLTDGFFSTVRNTDLVKQSGAFSIELCEDWVELDNNKYFDKKKDNGKLRYDLIPWRALQGVIAVSTFGLSKYEEDSWRAVPDAIKRYTAALLRHLSKKQLGQRYDEESGLLHDYHIAWNAMAIAELEALADSNKETSDEP